MKIQQKELIRELTNMTHDVIKRLEAFKNLSDDSLNWRENDEKWSILECFEHLKLYGDFYIPECNKRIQPHLISSTTPLYFKSGILGNYFAKMMLPSDQMKKISSPKDKNPIFSRLNKEVLEDFEKQQYELLELLKTSEGLNLTKIKTGISISNFIKLRIGDTYRVVIYHNLRHLIQAENVLSLLKATDFQSDKVA
ncbi:MAG: DinB family protein [Bacteroidota bacterium]